MDKWIGSYGDTGDNPCRGICYFGNITAEDALMSEDVRWTAKPHTLAKIDIVKAYLSAWAPILSRQSRKAGTAGRLRIVDGFAASGRYKGGQEGSPVCALKAIMNHEVDLGSTPVDFTFIDEDASALALLQEEIRQLRPETCRAIGEVQTLEGQCQEVLPRLLKQLGREFGPAFVFLDQFGYAAVPLELIAQIMGHQSTEVFVFLNWQRQHPYLSDPKKADALTRAYGSPGWKDALVLPTAAAKSDFIRTFYRKALQRLGRATYVWDFAMCDKSDQLTHWLFFCTNSIRGLQEMKRAMWQVDPSGGFRFSDKYGPGQLALFSSYSDEALASEISERFQGQRVQVKDIRDYVLTETPAYRYGETLQAMWRCERLKMVDPSYRTRKPSFTQRLELIVEFPANTGSVPTTTIQPNLF